MLPIVCFIPVLYLTEIFVLLPALFIWLCCLSNLLFILFPFLITGSPGTLPLLPERSVLELYSFYYPLLFTSSVLIIYQPLAEGERGSRPDCPENKLPSGFTFDHYGKFEKHHCIHYAALKSHPFLLVNRTSKPAQNRPSFIQLF